MTNESPNRGVQLLRVGILDPSPGGHTLDQDTLVQALADFSEFSVFATLEDPAISMFSHGETCFTVRQFRLALVLKEETTRTAIGHVAAYAETVLAGHLVSIELSELALMA